MPKIQFCVYFGSLGKENFGTYITGPFGIFHKYLAHSKDILYIFFSFWYIVPRKIWQPWYGSSIICFFGWEWNQASISQVTKLAGSVNFRNYFVVKISAVITFNTCLIVSTFYLHTCTAGFLAQCCFPMSLGKVWNWGVFTGKN
jgi:hypothetical protein